LLKLHSDKMLFAATMIYFWLEIA